MAQDRYFWFGGVSSMAAACCSHPLDTLKVSLQVREKTRASAVRTALAIVREQGFLSLYSGLSASLLRQGTYSTVRFGLYDRLKSKVVHSSMNNGAPLSLPQKIVVAMAAGAVGGVFGNPADRTNVIMQADLSRPVAERRNFKHAFDGLRHLVQTEGMRGLAGGLGPNIFRSMLMTASQLASYDQIKHLLIDTGYFQDNGVTHFTGSFLAGFVATLIVAPVDRVKTTTMNAAVRQSAPAVFATIFKNEGVHGFFKGFWPAWIRLGPHTIGTFVVLEQLRKHFN